MTIAVLVSKRGIARTLARPSKERRLKTAIDSATTVVMEANAFDATNATKSPLLSAEAMAAQEALQQAMRTACRICTEDA